VNDLPLLAIRAEIEKIRPFFLQVPEEEKATHHPGVARSILLATLRDPPQIHEVARSVLMCPATRCRLGLALFLSYQSFAKNV
jgi:hypothetical protein